MAVTAAQVKALREKTGVGMMECKKALNETDGDIDKAILYLRERGLSRAAKKAGRVTAEGKVEIFISADKTAGAVLEINCETDFVSKNQDFMDFAQAAAQLALENNAADAEALLAMTMADGKVVKDKLTELISTIGENLNVRRVKVLHTKAGVVAGYSHMGGKIGAMVALEGAQGSEVEALGREIAMHCAASSPRYLHSEQVDPQEIEQEKELGRKKILEQGKPENMVEKILTGQINKFYKEICLLDQLFVRDQSMDIKTLVKNQGQGAKLVDFSRFQLGEGIEKKQEDFAAEVAAAVKS